MNLQRIALMVAVLAVPCSANAFWGGSNGSCGGRAVCCAPACEPSCGSHGGSFGGCLSRVFSHGCCGSHGGFFGHRHSCGCEVSCGCQSSCGCGCESSCGCEQKSCGCGSNSGCSSCGGSSEGSSCGCGGEVKSESKPEAAAPAPAPAQEEAKKYAIAYITDDVSARGASGVRWPAGSHGLAGHFCFLGRELTVAELARVQTWHDQSEFWRIQLPPTSASAERS